MAICLSKLIVIKLNITIANDQFCGGVAEQPEKAGFYIYNFGGILFEDVNYT